MLTMLRRWTPLCLVALIAANLTTAIAQEKAAPKLPAGATLTRDLEYGPHERNKLDIYLPVKSATTPPLVIWIHGGGWQGGSKDGAGPARALLEKGYAVASINYRYSQHAPFPAQIHDCKGAVRYLRAHAKEHGYDGSKVGAWGASAGGHLVALLATTGGMKDLEGDGGNKNQSSRIDCGIDWFGPSDFMNWGKVGQHAPTDIANGAITKLFGGSVGSKLGLAKLASPITHVSADTSPLLLVHGDKDNLVPLQQSELFHERLKQAKIDAKLFVVKDGGHGQGFQAPEVAKTCLDFLNSSLKKK
jgi:acetyl esterase/lipase